MNGREYRAGHDQARGSEQDDSEDPTRDLRPLLMRRRILRRKQERASAANPSSENSGSEIGTNAAEKVAHSSNSEGSPLPRPLQRRFEASLGTDLSSVRVHTGAPSAEAAKSIEAQAYTVGNNIHFGA